MNYFDKFNELIQNNDHKYTIYEYIKYYKEITKSDISNLFMEYMINLFISNLYININVFINFNIYNRLTIPIDLLSNHFVNNVDYLITPSKKVRSRYVSQKNNYFLSKKAFEYILFSSNNNKIITDYFIIKFLYYYYHKYLLVLKQKNHNDNDLRKIYNDQNIILIRINEIKNNILILNESINKIYDLLNHLVMNY